MKNTSKFKNILLALFISFSFTLPLLSFAEDPVVIKDSDINQTKLDVIKDIIAEKGKYTFIAPFGPFANLINDTTDLTTPDALGNYLKTWFKFLIGIGSIIGVVRLVMAGFEIITKSGSIDAISRAKKEIVAIVSSLVLVALSWVILNSLNPDLVNKSLVLPSTLSKTSAPVVDEGDSNQDFLIGVTKAGYYYKATNNNNGNSQYVLTTAKNMEDCLALAKVKKEEGFTIQTDTCYDFSKFTASEKETYARNFLAQYNVYTKSRHCSSQSECGCSYMAGLNEGTLKKIGELARDCCGGQTNCRGRADTQNNPSQYCPVVITAAAETCGHQSHGGPDTFDLRLDSRVVSFLKKNAIYIAPSFNGNLRYKYKNLWYTYEYGGSAVHFHVCQATAARNGSSSSCADLSKTYTDAHCKPTGVQTPEGEQQKCN